MLTARRQHRPAARDAKQSLRMVAYREQKKKEMAELKDNIRKLERIRSFLHTTTLARPSRSGSLLLPWHEVAKALADLRHLSESQNQALRSQLKHHEALYQGGFHEDMLPFQHIVPAIQSTTDGQFTIQEQDFDALHVILAPWYKTHDISRVAKLWADLPLLQESIVIHACMYGYVDVLAFLHSRSMLLPERWSTKMAMDVAARSGHVDVLAFLHPLLPEGACTVKAMNWAAKFNHLHVLKWLHTHSTAGATAMAMNYAAEGGHLEVVKWLHTHRHDGCTTDAMDDAATNGHLDVVKFLHEHRTEGCTSDAIDGAAAEGHLHVVEWLHANRSEGCTEDAMDEASEAGHLKVVQFLHHNRSEGCTEDALNEAAKEGHLDVVKFLLAHRHECEVDEAMDCAKQAKRRHVVTYLREYLATC
ncbi:hypothetical protein DYB32_007760 [Aphanomyces invadans]|uniref:Uncharacterized protein n=1 Tax=Aphanomyces invadans TaxID=157072 RepID=A0A418AN18_9STRA|nr:hypothetical protein DYB32_007760 [Aphanomyces invadans]